MSKCIHCGVEYKREGGDILMPECDRCREENKKDPCPESYVRKNGLLIQNPEYELWKQRHPHRR